MTTFSKQAVTTVIVSEYRSATEEQGDQQTPEKDIRKKKCAWPAGQWPVFLIYIHLHFTQCLNMLVYTVFSKLSHQYHL